ncbi:pyrroloquinoline quinone biosynthesis protein PqqB [Amycolatopsis sp. cmx-4-61]|uniref:pyrroloquinoline quinone biosynthesis protein PqqB n=1 Tax=Amycolatopsis sp. cmx-4-61 TaxID=2790937 RepID=UPI00397B4A61
MKVRILGTAAGGGVPQWNCACPQCTVARRTGAARTQDCLAVSANGSHWHLVNASPDLRVQILAAPDMVPGPGRRDTPVRGVLLTDAELDHTLGLLALREGAKLDVYGSAPVLLALDDCFPIRRIMGPYGSTRWHEVVAGEPFELSDGLQVRAVPLGAKRPRYAADQPARDDWVLAYRFADPVTGSALLYAPCLAEWTPAFGSALKGVSQLVVDGSFYHQDEMIRTAGWAPSSRDMGHLPISESLEALAAHPGLRCLYTHVNNTNPVLDPHSAERDAVRAAGADVATEGHELEL